MGWRRILKMSKAHVGSFSGSYNIGVAGLGLGQWGDYKVIAFGNSIDARDNMMEYSCNANKIDNNTFSVTSHSVKCIDRNVNHKVYGGGGSAYYSNCRMRDTVFSINSRVHIKCLMKPSGDQKMYVSYDVYVDDVRHSRVSCKFSYVENSSNVDSIGDNIFYGAGWSYGGGPSGYGIICKFAGTTNITYVGDRNSIKIDIRNVSASSPAMTKLEELTVDIHAVGTFQDISSTTSFNGNNMYLLTAEL